MDIDVVPLCVNMDGTVFGTRQTIPPQMSIAIHASNNCDGRVIVRKTRRYGVFSGVVDVPIVRILVRDHIVRIHFRICIVGISVSCGNNDGDSALAEILEQWRDISFELIVRLFADLTPTFTFSKGLQLLVFAHAQYE